MMRDRVIKTDKQSRQNNTPHFTTAYFTRTESIDGWRKAPFRLPLDFDVSWMCWMLFVLLRYLRDRLLLCYII
jgi:hypothetical protein